MINNPYLYPDIDCLKNKLGITNKDELAKFENDVTSARLSNLRIHPLPGELDFDYFKAIHKYLCNGIYEWAGQERIIQTTRGGTRFEWPENIQKVANRLFAELNKENQLKGLNRSEFIERAAYYFSELNVVHPFPDGNGRSQRTLFDQIARKAGFEFNWQHVTKDQFIEAMIYAYAIDTSKIEVVFDQTLSELDR